MRVIYIIYINTHTFILLCPCIPVTYFFRFCWVPVSMLYSYPKFAFVLHIRKPCQTSVSLLVWYGCLTQLVSSPCHLIEHPGKYVKSMERHEETRDSNSVKQVTKVLKGQIENELFRNKWNWYFNSNYIRRTLYIHIWCEIWNFLL